MNEMIRKPQDEELVPLNEIRVVFLGDGGVGKSHIIARLMNDGGNPTDFMDTSTPGIIINHKDYNHNGRQFCVHYWDFGGQDILHSMYRMFLTERTVYVVVVGVRDGMQDERARYWLSNIKKYAPNAPVLLVLNQNDLVPNARVNELRLISLFPNLKRIISMSARSLSKESFEREFEGALLEQIDRSGLLDSVWPAKWLDVKDTLEHMDAAYITLEAYRQICTRFGVLINQGEMLDWFRDLGVCTYFKETGDRIVLRAAWITNALFTILFNLHNDVSNGLISQERISELLTDCGTNESIRYVNPYEEYTWRDVQYIMTVMRKFRFSLDVGNSCEILPMLCVERPSGVLLEYANDETVLEFHIRVEYLPDELLYTLMAERRTELDISNIWYMGARFIQRKTGLSAVVHIENNTLRFFIRSTDPEYAPNICLSEISDHVEQICTKIGIPKPEEQIVYKQDGHRDLFDYKKLMHQMEAGEIWVYSSSLRSRIPIANILNPVTPEAIKAKRLALDITNACAELQNYKLPHREDDINVCLKLLLKEKGYRFADPDLVMAGSSGGRRRGAPDLILADDQQKPLTMIEAINIRSGSMVMRYCEEHLAKLLHQYNTLDLSPLFLVCYVDCEADKYPRLRVRYQDHMHRYAPERSDLVYGSYTELPHNRRGLHIASCRYLVNGKEIKVYHCFVRVTTSEYNMIPPELIKLGESPRKQETQKNAEPEAPPVLPQPVVVPETPQQGETIFRDYRVVFLGDSEAGKTLLLSRLENPELDPKDFHDNTTIGINIVRKTQTINGQTVRLNYWDFGGQDILHSMHRIFLAKNTLYVIVLNTRNDNQDAQAIFWLRYVEAYAPGSPVLLVMNKTDQNKRAALNLPVLNRLFSNREFEQEDVLKISAVCPDKEKFHREFTEKLHECVGRHMKITRPFTEQEARIRDRVEQKKAEENLKLIRIGDFQDICEEEALEDEDAQYELMDRFNETGVLVYFQSKSVMFMNPEWITKTIYVMLEQDEQIADNGVVRHKKIYSFFRKNKEQTENADDVDHLLRIMRDYALSFPCGDPSSADREFIPMLCQREEPREIGELIDRENTVELRMVFEYLPCGVLYKLMVDHQKSLDMDLVWRTGMKLNCENGNYAVVRQEGNVMGIYVHDSSITRRIEWMSHLRDKTEEAAKHDKFNALLLETKIAYSISGMKEYFDYQQLKNAEECKVYYTVSRSVPPHKIGIRDILLQKDSTINEYIWRLLKLTFAGCQELQKQQIYWFLAKEAKDDRLHPKMDEDARTEVIRMKLSAEFIVKPQARAGDSSTGKKQGELDLRIELDENTTLAILEALNIAYNEEDANKRFVDMTSGRNWDEHLDRVVRDYNKEGIRNLLLVSYLDCPAEQTVQAREKYFDRLNNHVIPGFGSPEYCEPIPVDEFSDGIQVVRADYSGGAGSVTVYHFLVRIEQYGRKSLEKAAKNAKETKK